MTTISKQSMVGQKAFPAISIILSTNPQYPKFKADRERLISLLKNAEHQLKQKYSKQKTELLMDKLHRVVNNINFNHLAQGIAIYVSSNDERVIHLPFAVSEKVIVDESFEIRDLIYSAKKNKSYLLTTISQNRVKTFLGSGNSLVTTPLPDMPENIKDVTNEHSFPGWDYLDTKAYEEKNIRNFLHFIDEILEREIRHTNLPVILMGDIKLMGLFRQHTMNKKNILGYVEGNFDHSPSNELLAAIRPVLNSIEKKEQDHALVELATAVSKDTYAAGIAEVWKAATEARGRLLVVEKDYRQPARFGDDSYNIIIDDVPVTGLNLIADAVDDVLEHVLLNNGDIIFVENGMLPDFQRIALITRY
ncbi:MAG: hypothetical protein NT126_09260 [Bacteroidetes bacterium]|nr:hypothetical protein [Bacteroidota bacterium]